MSKRESDVPLSASIVQSMQQYLDDLNGEKPSNLHAFFLQEVEKPFLQVVMRHVDHNQSLAAEILGINRNTLRKKLLQYKLLLPTR